MMVDETRSEEKKNGRKHPVRVAFKIVVGVLAWLAVSLGAVLIGSALWIRRTFGAVSVDQLLMNLPGAGGAEVTGAETGYVRSFLLEALLIPMIAVAVVAVLFYLARRRWWAPKPVLHESKWAALRFRKLVPGVAAVAVVAIGASVFLDTVGAAQYVRSQTTTLTMSDYYVAPDLDGDVATIQLGEVDEAPKNLVFIFLESIEDQMANTELFEQNMLEPVQQATDGWQSIDNYQMYEGGGWTMAGLVGSSCGVPLRGAGTGENDINSNEIGAEVDDFMPGAVCLGDVLSANGYQNVFLGGADASFASKGKFLTNHGYDEVKDLSTWAEEGETEVSAWGLSDRRLMDHAREEIVRLHDSGEPFNLTMLTLDSHEPAHLYENCTQTTEDILESVIRCSMSQVASFIQFMDGMGYLDDTVVVLSGDHPKMVGDGFASLNALATVDNRPVFNRIWSPDELQIARDGVDQLSMFATILDALDLGRDDHRAGVGVSALVTDSPGSVLDLNDEQYAEVIQSASRDLYRELWRSGETSSKT